ncbi:MAG: hypothetical protein LBK95_05395, partial [Bifidobacteriaceae bacterium]|nr:hypothetical protein [Bifidobacteriaceae bacterium]
MVQSTTATAQGIKSNTPARARTRPSARPARGRAKTATSKTATSKTATSKTATSKPAARRTTAPRSGAEDRQLADFYRQMLLIRRFEERAGRSYTQALIGGYLHLNLGEEAFIVGSAAAMEPTDYLFTNYREHGFALARGAEPGRVMAELYGRADGLSKGWGGSM